MALLEVLVAMVTVLPVVQVSSLIWRQSKLLRVVWTYANADIGVTTVYASPTGAGTGPGYVTHCVSC